MSGTPTTPAEAAAITATVGTGNAARVLGTAPAPSAPPDTPTDRVNGVSQNPNVPNADGSAYGSNGQSSSGDSTTPVLRYTGGGLSNSGGTPPPDDADLRAAELASVQGTIDDSNKQYADSLSTVNTVNANLTGGTRATDARSGTLGSSFGNANEANAADKAQANIAKLTDAHNKELNTIYDGINKDIAAKDTAAANQDAKLTDEQNKTLSANAFKAVDGLAAKGTPLDSLTQDEYNHIIASTGMTDDQLHAYYAGKVPQDKIVKEEIQNGQYVQVTRDPTGAVSINTTPLPANVPADYVPTTLPSGQKAFIPKGTAPTGVVYSSTMDPNAPLNGKMVIYDGPGSNKVTKSGAATKPPVGAPKGVTSDDISAGETRLEGMKGSDGYVDPYKYQDMYNLWASHGGTSAAFAKAYPAKNYVNPEDNDKLPSYLQSPTKTAAASTGPKPSAKIIGVVRQARAGGETEAKIRTDILNAGYNPDDPAFK